jgi:hypothetical protein
MLKPKEIADIGLLLWYLPLQKVAEIKQTALALKKECGYAEPTDDSDEWTDEDIADLARASAIYAEESVPWESNEESAAKPMPLSKRAAASSTTSRGGVPQ